MSTTEIVFVAVILALAGLALWYVLRQPNDAAAAAAASSAPLGADGQPLDPTKPVSRSDAKKAIQTREELFAYLRDHPPTFPHIG